MEAKKFLKVDKTSKIRVNNYFVPYIFLVNLHAMDMCIFNAIKIYDNIKQWNVVSSHYNGLKLCDSS